MTSPKLFLPLLQPNQAQKHVTVNESLMPLGPSGPADRSVGGRGDTASLSRRGRHLSDWSGAFGCMQREIRFHRDMARRRLSLCGAASRLAGSQTSTSKDWRHDGSNWTDTPAAPLSLPGLAVNTATDPANRLSVRADATLFIAETGDHRIHLNRTAVTDTVSLFLETGHEADAEIGLTGSEALEIMVRDTSGTWRQAMQISRDTAAIQAHAVFSGEVDIPEDGAASIQTPWAGGLFAFASIDSVYPQAAHSGLAATIQVRRWLW